MTQGIRKFLNQTEPAMLLIWCAVVLVSAAVLGYLSLRLSGFRTDFLEYQWSSDSIPTRYYTVAGNRSTADILQEWAGYAAGIGAFWLGVIGTLLPMWAVGRLIADAIRKGSEP